MLWFGRMELESRWRVATPAFVEEAVRALLPQAFGGAGTVRIDRTAACGPATITGQRTRIELRWVSFSELKAPVTWITAPPRGMANYYLRCAACARRGGGTLAVAYYGAPACYRLEELARALEASFEYVPRQWGSASVLHSAHRPLPVLRPTRIGDLAGTLAVFRCQNPNCASRGAEVLVALRNALDASLQERRVAGAIAYPCPRCPGAWPARWALTWVRRHAHGSSTGPHLLVDYPIPPSQPRIFSVPGAMQRVTAAPRAVKWGSVWDRGAVRRVPAQIQRFTRCSNPQVLLHAFRSDPEAAGALTPFLLTPDNLRAFVAFCRTLPVAEKVGRLPTALAIAFNPRRTSNYVTARDACQLADKHYHYIAFSPDSFFEQLCYYGLPDHRGRFLDVGSGVGEKVFLAFALGQFTACDGLEYAPQTVAVAEFLLAAIAPLDPYPIRVIQGDALSFTHYADYDVIYMYRPFSDPVRMGWLVRRIADQMKVGAVMFDVFEPGLALRKVCADKYVTATRGADGLAQWNQPVLVDDFLARHALL